MTGDSFAYYRMFAERRAPEEEIEPLVALAKTGDMHAMDRIARMSIRLAMVISARLSQGCRNAMDEMLCEAMIAVPKIVADYDPSKGVPFFSYCGMKLAFAAMYVTKNRKRREARGIESSIDNDILAETVICRDDHVDRVIASLTIPEIVGKLPPRQAGVVRRWYGIGCDPMTDTEIGREMCISKEQSLYARHGALKFMREQLERKAGA